MFASATGRYTPVLPIRWNMQRLIHSPSPPRPSLVR
jgi:hypothetical protein